MKEIIFILILGLGISCGTTQKVNSPSTSLVDIEMYKGVCFGQCPVYRISLFSSDMLLYEGIRFTDKLGVWTRDITESERSNINDLLSICSEESYKAYYESRLPDLAPTVLYFNKNGERTSHKFKEEAPDELIMLSQALDKIAQSGLWTLEKRWEESPEYLKDQIIVQVANSKIEDILKSYQQYALRMEKEISPTVYVIEYKSEMISPGQLFMKLKSDNRVTDVEFKQKLELRSQ